VPNFLFASSGCSSSEMLRNDDGLVSAFFSSSQRLARLEASCSLLEEAIDGLARETKELALDQMAQEQLSENRHSEDGKAGSDETVQLIVRATDGIDHDATELKERYAWSEELEALGQSHVSNALIKADAKDAKRLLSQLRQLDEQYPGGLRAYLCNARRLLRASVSGENPFTGLTPKPPNGVRLDPSSDPTAFMRMEEAGIMEAKKTAYVLVAGGLGERLGYPGIKVSLPVELATGRCYLQVYIEYIMAVGGSDAELAIMTSDDTHKKTQKLLEENGYFGMDQKRVTLIKQEKVPSLADLDASFVVDHDSASGLSIKTKPHGHGDVHSLIRKSGLSKRWSDKGLRWVMFFQDTNALVFRGIPAALGVAKENKFSMNSITVARRPGEPKGAICRLEPEKGKGSKDAVSAGTISHPVTMNVEYNQLDPLLRATQEYPDGDVAGEGTGGFSPFPGNINAFLVEMDAYSKVLERSGGLVPEFVNPKYADAKKVAFKKPTRLECMMQELPRLFPAEAANRVGFTMFPRWLVCSSVKNNPTDAVKKMKKTGHPESASSGEADFYRVNRKLLSDLGCNIKVDAGIDTYLGVQVKTGARVVLSPSFAPTLCELKKKISSPNNVHISSTSTLVLDGERIQLNALKLDGALRVVAKSAQNVSIGTVEDKKVRFFEVNNKGHVVKALDESAKENAKNSPPAIVIRGYKAEIIEEDSRIYDNNATDKSKNIVLC